MAYKATVFNIVSQLFNHAKLCSVISGIDGESGRRQRVRKFISENLSRSRGRTAKCTPGPAVTTELYFKIIPIPRRILPLPLPCNTLLQVQVEEEELSWKPADQGLPGKTSVKWKHWHQAPNWLDVPPIRHKVWHTLHFCSSRRQLFKSFPSLTWQQVHLL